MAKKKPEDRTLARLKQELAATRAYLQSVIEGKEAANEELKAAANEEVTSSNEELQSTNEGLETTKGEPEANEELTTVNDELQNRITVASQLSDDLTNLIDSVAIPTIVVDRDLRLRRVTPSAERILHLLPTDIGRPIGDFKLKLKIDNLESLLHEVLETYAFKVFEVTDEQGVWYRMRIHPYRRSEDKIDGAILTLLEIDALKHRERQIEEESGFSNNIINTVPVPLLILDAGLHVRYANPAFYKTFQTTPRETEQQLFYTLGNRQWDIPRLRALVDAAVTTDQPFSDFEVRRPSLVEGERVMLISARGMIKRESESGQLILLAIEDITDRRQLEKQIIDIADREQRRIGQELHDNAGQELTGLRMMMDALVKGLESRGTEEAALGVKVRDGLDRVHLQIRWLARSLIPMQIAPGELHAALDDLTARTTETCDCKASFVGDSRIRVGDSARATHLYRIAQEAIANAIRHGKCKQIVVSLKQDAKTVHLTIQDDGAGIPDLTAAQRGMGIKNMQYRAGLNGGKLSISSAAGGGTQVACTLPKDE